MAKPVWTNEQIIDQLDSGYAWSGSNLTYGFPTSVNWFPYAEKDGFLALTDEQQTAATLAIKLWDDLIAPDFSLAADGAAANIKYSNTTTSIGYAHAYFPSAWPGGGSVWFNPQYNASSGTNNLVSPTVGAWGWAAYVHETGHALGLDHPGEYNGGSPTYANDALYVQDSQMYTIMSYFDAANTGADWYASDGRLYFAQTPMMHDIMTAQAMYGTETTTRTGDTVYGFHSNAGVWLYDFAQNQHPVLCIFDSAGNDTLDLSGWNYSCVIDLAPGSYSSADAMTYNISIAYDAQIENGIGGGGNDILGGNDLGNYLAALGGDDVLTGGGGNDVLDGGSGNDTAVFSGTRADYSVASDPSSETVTVRDLRLASPDGQDWVSNVENFQFSDGVIALADLLSGNGSDNGGDPSGDITTITGTNRTDTLEGMSSVDQIYGLAKSDILIGYAGDDLLIGGAGADKMIGGLGNDTYVVDNTGDLVDETGGDGIDTVQSSVTFSLADAVHAKGEIENLTLTGSKVINATGNALDNTIIGNIGTNVLAGLGGADTLDGGAGTDTATYAASGLGVNVSLATGLGSGGDAEGDVVSNIENLVGSAFGDTLTGDGFANRIDGGAGDDTIEGGAGNDVLIGGTHGVRGDTVSYANAEAGVAVNLAKTSEQNTVGSGKDKLSGFENVTGSAFDDALTGTAGNNILTGLAGNDTLSGGAGLDTFLFDAAGFGDDTITDFNSAQDFLQFKPALFANYLAVLDSAEQSGLDTIITAGSDTVTLLNVAASSLNQSNIRIG